MPRLCVVFAWAWGARWGEEGALGRGVRPRGGGSLAAWRNTVSLLLLLWLGLPGAQACKLSLKIIRANGLDDPFWLPGDVFPFVIVADASGTERCRTKRIDDNPNPVWNKQCDPLDATYGSPRPQRLTFQVWAEGFLLSDKKIGTYEFDTADTGHGARDCSDPLSTTRRLSKGTLTFTYCYDSCKCEQGKRGGRWFGRRTLA